MTKFTGKDMKLVWNSITLGVGGSCLASVDVSDDVDVYTAECAGATAKINLPGLRNIQVDVQGYLQDTDVALLNAIAPGVSDTDFVFHPAGDTGGNLELTSTKATASSRPVSVSVNGITTFGFTLMLDQLTITTA